MPPVKLACLACRATRVRCNGEQPCSNCLRKERDCSYLPSRRGGARNRPTQKLNNVYLDDHIVSQADEYINRINEFLSPGTGLRRSVLSPLSEQQCGDHGASTHGRAGSIQGPSAVRMYIKESSILNAYYIFIHPFFPVLPPPPVSIHQDDPIYWSAETGPGLLSAGFSSPLSLAILAMLALIPVREDGFDQNVDLNARSRIAHRFARQALEMVEVDTEHANFAFASQYMDTTDGQQCIDREPLHPGLPVELESIVSLLILSNYEHAQRGNLLKMAARSCQASALAKGLSLHCQSPIEDDFSEARRRTWWMTYATSYLTSLACHKSFIAIVDESEITTPYPQLGSDAQCWPIFVETLRISMASLQFTASEKAGVLSGQGLVSTQQQIQDLRNSIEKASTRLGSCVHQFTSGYLDLTAWETNSAQIMRRLCHIKLASATIQIYRYQAFGNIPVFIKDYCKITSVSRAGELGNPYKSQQSQGTNHETHLTPLSQPQSASLCVDAALAIARHLQQIILVKVPEGDRVLPSLMPISTCCAMQATYSMVMQLSSIRISRASEGNLQPVANAERLLDEIFHGLERIVQILEHHARIYVALSGVKDQVQAIFQLEFQNGI
ncbi:hypothetical protein BGZ63DRAFT_394945 [Mariannaea sp. PMI_226]|nr:hypothetical protein BGZ63DRAFT_394945 [Mariannaea sp. PMI_226]